MAVRSVAVHPQDPSIVLRGGGAVVDGELKSGLWRSADGGGTWRLVTDKIDFDGSGPTTLLGEAIAFNEKIPNLVAAGGESSGLHSSHDAGDGWGLQKGKGKELCVGERITCLRSEPTASRGENLVVGTFADRELEALGLGKPFRPARGTGNVYRLSSSARDRLKSGWVTDLSLPDFGVTNIGFGTYYCFQSMATTRGVCHTRRNGGIFHQRRVEIPADGLYVALEDRRFMKELRPRSVKLRATTYAAPLSSPGANRPYVCPDRLPRKWETVTEQSTSADGPPNAHVSQGSTCILADRDRGGTLYLCNVDGIYRTTDSGRTCGLIHRSPVE